MKRCLRLFIAVLTFTIGVCIAPPKSSDNPKIIQHIAISADLPKMPEKPSLVVQEKIKLTSEKLSVWKVLLSLEGQDLTNLEEESEDKLKKIIKPIIERETDYERDFSVPWLFTKLSDARGQVLYVYIEEHPAPYYKGASRLCIYIFDTKGRRLGFSKFPTGRKTNLYEMKVKFLPEVGRDVLVISTGFGGSFGKQYYALVEDKVLLIPLEESGFEESGYQADRLFMLSSTFPYIGKRYYEQYGNEIIRVRLRERGEIEQNSYTQRQPDVGLALKRGSAEEWEKSLESSDTAEVLATLTWLGGRHLNPQKPYPDWAGPEHIKFYADMREVRLFSGVRSRKGKSSTQ